MIDLHIHCLPGIDDGARDLAEAVAMCRLAAEDGCSALIATPHQRNETWWNTERTELEDLLRELESALRGRPRLFSGGEIRVDSQLLVELEKGPDSGLMTLAGSSYLLLELDRLGLGPEPEELVHELRVAGWRPIFAHPEFIPRLADDPTLRLALVRLGALFQITAMSVTGEFGRDAQRSVDEMLSEGTAHFLASDAHSVDWRPPGLRRAFDRIGARWGEAVARRLAVENPQAVLENRPIEALATADGARR